MKRVTILTLLLVLCFALLLAAVPAQRPARMAWQAVQASSPQLAPRTDVVTHTHRLGAMADTITLRLEAQVASGELACVLIDPQGRVRWTSQIEGPALTQRSRSFDAIPGEWKLKLALAKLSGRYDVAWSSH